ncbi:TonB-dependent receptor plug domain-containing protein [Novosphingobium olei]|uniref:TonB-dependent receptor plug domain-containing protein n=1 Tax=Novosphingobium olei TaxID=2728851 RepID=UPI0030906251|nr:TonB-dependent receptor plug domain-containing protein [Novosphingobium olei]
MQSFRNLAAPLLFSSALATPAFAAGDASTSAPETEAPTPALESGRTVFTPADFARFAPRNALDLLRVVPGFSIREAEQARGLGQASGNVLVNGQRLSSKSDDIYTQLSRIPASTVERIELVDAATLKVPGLSGQVANIIARTDSFSGQFRWEPQVRPHYAHPRLYDGEISVSGRQDWVEYTISLVNDANRGAAGGPTTIRDAGGRIVERRHDELTSDEDNPKLAGRFVIDGPGSSVINLNASIQKIWSHYDERSQRTRLPAEAPWGGPDRLRLIKVRNDTWNWELGGDVEFALGPGRLKLIGLNRESHEPYLQTVVTSYADQSPADGDLYAQVGDTSERIARAEYSWKMFGGDWQIAGEGAFNRLDNVASVGTLADDGSFTREPFPGGTGGVAEDRYDASLSVSRPVSKTVTLQFVGGAEWSTLRQTGADGLQRRFFRPKGSLSLAWKPDPTFDLSVRVRRRVGQLSFYDFLARRFLDNGNANAGNAELVPQQDWTLEVEANKNLGRWGSTKLRFIGRQVEDYVTVVPVGPDGESVGNVPRARVRILESNTTLQLEPLGWKGARVDVHLLLQHTRLKDPVTLRTITYSNITDRLAEIELRDDLPGTNWAIGGSFNYSHQSLGYRVGEFGRDWEGPVFAGLYVENKNVFGLTVRASADNLLNARRRWDRVVYAGRRDQSPILFTETRNQLIGPLFTLLIKGSF